MIDVILTFDNLNPNGGQFMNACLEDINNYFSNKQHRLTILTSHEINSETINLSTKDLKSFIFVPYCHGNESCLGNINSEIFISPDLNITNFSNTFFYTFSCSSGLKLGPELIKNNCICFFGYNNTIYSIIGHNQFQFCANFGLFLFIEGINTDAILIQMKKTYEEKVDELYKVDFFSASHLRSNKDSLIKIGKNITINDLINNA
ncbi:hypothetical protein FIA58_015465 [Flavobacterium jejuense]|uniref:Uncharacterized protein n=1 Tax=Flavobacterium jejuense TaxID=1544455 RepID=A0ABX0IU59_9FLAO|nr:hypothetical protein [Flavobacterium jejuense]NHN27081.1 hypothetical protein [Flavobacterium jejuense]